MSTLPNPLAIGVTLGGLLLEVLVPRPKPQAGPARDPSLLYARSVPRTTARYATPGEHDGPPIASGTTAALAA